MAIAIKIIPTLKEQEAKKFDSAAARAKAGRGTVDFSAKVMLAKKILKKSKLKY